MNGGGRSNWLGVRRPYCVELAELGASVLPLLVLGWRVWFVLSGATEGGAPGGWLRGAGGRGGRVCLRRSLLSWAWVARAFDEVVVGADCPCDG